MTARLHSLSFLGAGNMAEALLKGALRRQLLPPAKILMVDKSLERLEFLRETYGARVSDDPGEAFHPCGTLFLAVKPQDVPGLLETLRAKAQADPSIEKPYCCRVVTICAGVTTRQIEEGFPQGPNGEVAPVVRVMPNTPAAIGEGASGVAAGSRASREDMEAALEIMGCAGLAIEVVEDHLNAVTGLSGSGPAYVFRLIEAMIAGGEAAGLPPEAARRLTLQTVLGSVRLAIESDEEPAVLRERVTSPGGTTAAGLQAMEKGRFFETVVEAIQAATRRGEELGRGE